MCTDFLSMGVPKYLRSNNSGKIMTELTRGVYVTKKSELLTSSQCIKITEKVLFYVEIRRRHFIGIVKYCARLLYQSLRSYQNVPKYPRMITTSCSIHLLRV